MNTLFIEYAIAFALGRMQRPTGQALIGTGKALKKLGQEVEDLGHILVDTAPVMPYAATAGPSKKTSPGWRPYSK